jgi:hypothetical protein
MVQITASRIVHRAIRALAPAFALALATLSIAVAQENTLLTKAEVETLTVGKMMKYVRASDNETMAYDVRDGGLAFHTSTNLRRAVNVKGQWTIGDDGALCFKWENTDRYVTVRDGCFKFRRAGDKIQVVGSRNPDNVIGDLVQ